MKSMIYELLRQGDARVSCVSHVRLRLESTILCDARMAYVSSASLIRIARQANTMNLRNLVTLAVCAVLTRSQQRERNGVGAAIALRSWSHDPTLLSCAIGCMWSR